MSAIQPSIVARLKPELVPMRYDFIYDGVGEFKHVKKWQPLEYKDQILDLLPDEDAHPFQTAQIGNVFAEIVCVHTEQRARDIQERKIRVQFHHKTEA